MADPHYPAKPTTDEVASLLRARTVDQFGKELQTFTDETRPTESQAQDLVNAAFDLVNLRVGMIPDGNPDLISQGKAVVMLLAARLVETVYYPEQAAQNESAADLYGAMYEDAIRSLEMAIRDDRASTSTGFMSSIPMKGLAALEVEELPINWEQRDMDDPL